MIINILISTIDQGIYRVKEVLLPYRSDVKYIISHQFTSKEKTPIPEELIREDVVISQIAGKGVTKSRNHALTIADGDIGLFADDDVTYRNSYFDELKTIFQQNPTVDVALLKIKTKDDEPEYKKYPDEVEKLTKTKYSISTIEIAVNLANVKKETLKFDERFGAGQKRLIGSDETIYVEDAIKMGLNVTYFPVFIVEHPYQSTINSIPFYDKRRNWVTGAYDCRKNGVIAIPKAFLGTIKYFPNIIKNRKNPLLYLFQRLSAVIYILSTNWKYKK